MAGINSRSVATPLMSAASRCPRACPLGLAPVLRRTAAMMTTKAPTYVRRAVARRTRVQCIVGYLLTGLAVIGSCSFPTGFSKLTV